ncbi:MAG: hypothetical protein IBX68_02605 [Dehalococcoidia bacterium]|nr:hypothetical protein [Dehalococcoidia bacterium]
MDLRPRLTEQDLDFVLETAAPDFSDRAKLRRLIVEDEDFRRGLVADEKVFERLMAEEDIFLRISPGLYFEVLLRRAIRELERATHTVERFRTQAIPVFDTKVVLDLLAEQRVLDYLADMLSSFTRIETFVVPVRITKGIWRKIRYNDMDIDSLSRMCETVGEESRLAFYKRIADVCLFVLGIFPEYAYFDYRYPFSGEVRPRIAGKARRGMEEYEEEGRKFYRLAAEHQSAKELEMSEIFWMLYENFNAARKPMNFISEHYLYYKKQDLFGAETGSRKPG